MTSLLDEYETWLRSWGASGQTVRIRRRFALVRLSEWGEPDHVTGTMLQGFLANPELSPWSRSTYYNHLGSWFGWLAEAGHIETNPMEMVRRPRQPRSAPKPLTAAEAEAALAAARGNLRTWLLLALYAGLRAHEVAKIRGEDVTEETIYVKGKGGTEAYIPTHPLIWEAAARYPARGWWFPNRDGTGRSGPPARAF